MVWAGVSCREGEHAKNIRGQKVLRALPQRIRMAARARMVIGNEV